jgi:LuxR family transcriptional regulator, maltose regulon positive regulatory protein
VGPLLAWLLQSKDPATEAQAFAKEILCMMGNTKALMRDELDALSTAASISTREQEVLQLLGAGLSNHAIAEKFCISDHTVRTHLVNIYRKLGVKNRTQAMARAQELGVLT